MLRFQTLLQTNWDWRAAGNFMFGGTGSGLLLMTVAATFPAIPPLPLGLAALAFVALGLTLVWFELGRMERPLNVFFHPQTSWMTREAFVAVAVFLLAVFGVLFSSPLAIGAAALAALGFLYCQAKILMASKGIPAWREPAIVPLVVVTGLTEGTGLLLLMLAALGNPVPWAVFVLLGLLAVRGVAWTSYRARFTGESVPPETRRALGDVHLPFMLGGNVLPAVLVVLALIAPSAARSLTAIAGLLAAIAGWYLKFVIVTGAAQVQGYAFGKKLRKGHPLGLKPSAAK